MVPEPSAASLPTPAASKPDPAREKVRIRFRKGGDLRLVSHHDLMHVFERVFRRAELPFHASEGFNPKPRMAFALSLALGIVGCEEVLELELDEPLSPEVIHQRLADHAPPGLEILSVTRIDRRTRAQVRRVGYQLLVPAQRTSGLPQRLAALLAAPECWIDRVRPQARRLDIRPYLRGLRLLPVREGNGEIDQRLEIDLWVTPYGAARPEEILGLLGLQDLLDEGAILERTKLALHDEDQTPDSGPTGLPAPGSGRKAAMKNAPRPAALVPGPLSFDS
jgi:radical SAM-linked protein